MVILDDGKCCYAFVRPGITWQGSFIWFGQTIFIFLNRWNHDICSLQPANKTASQFSNSYDILFFFFPLFFFFKSFLFYFFNSVYFLSLYFIYRQSLLFPLTTPPFPPSFIHFILFFILFSSSIDVFVFIYIFFPRLLAIGHKSESDDGTEIAFIRDREIRVNGYFPASLYLFFQVECTMK